MEFDRCLLFSTQHSSRILMTVLLIGSCKSYSNPLLCDSQPQINWCCSLAMCAWPNNFLSEGWRQEHLLQVCTTSLPALSQDWQLCGQLCSIHCDPHLNTTQIFHIFNVQSQNDGQTMLISMYEWDTWVGPEGIFPTWVAIRVPFSFSKGKHPYIKKLWWEWEKLLYSGDQLCFPSFPACQYATKDNSTTFSPPPRLGSLKTVHSMQDTLFQVPFIMPPSKSHLLLLVVPKPSAWWSKGWQRHLEVLPMCSILSSATDQKQPSIHSLYNPSTILCILMQSVQEDVDSLVALRIATYQHL